MIIELVTDLCARRNLGKDGKKGGKSDAHSHAWVLEQLISLLRHYPGGLTKAVIQTDLLAKQSSEQAVASVGEADKQCLKLSTILKGQQVDMGMIHATITHVDCLTPPHTENGLPIPKTGTYLVHLDDGSTTNPVPHYLHSSLNHMAFGSDKAPPVFLPGRQVRLTGACKALAAPSGAAGVGQDTGGGLGVVSRHRPLMPTASCVAELTEAEMFGPTPIMDVLLPSHQGRPPSDLCCARQVMGSMSGGDRRLLEGWTTARVAGVEGQHTVHLQSRAAASFQLPLILRENRAQLAWLLSQGDTIALSSLLLYMAPDGSAVLECSTDSIGVVVPPSPTSPDPGLHEGSRSAPRTKELQEDLEKEKKEKEERMEEDGEENKEELGGEAVSMEVDVQRMGGDTRSSRSAAGTENNGSCSNAVDRDVGMSHDQRVGVAAGEMHEPSLVDAAKASAPSSAGIVQVVARLGDLCASKQQSGLTVWVRVKQLSKCRRKTAQREWHVTLMVEDETGVADVHLVLGNDSKLLSRLQEGHSLLLMGASVRPPAEAPPDVASIWRKADTSGVEHGAKAGTSARLALAWSEHTSSCGLQDMSTLTAWLNSPDLHRRMHRPVSLPMPMPGPKSTGPGPMSGPMSLSPYTGSTGGAVDRADKSCKTRSLVEVQAIFAQSAQGVEPHICYASVLTANIQTYRVHKFCGRPVVRSCLDMMDEEEEEGKTKGGTSEKTSPPEAESPAEDDMSMSGLWECPFCGIEAVGNQIQWGMHGTVTCSDLEPSSSLSPCTDGHSGSGSAATGQTSAGAMTLEADDLALHALAGMSPEVWCAMSPAKRDERTIQVSCGGYSQAAQEPSRQGSSKWIVSLYCKPESGTAIEEAGRAAVGKNSNTNLRIAHMQPLMWS
eukprot:gene13689-19580_t